MESNKNRKFNSKPSRIVTNAECPSCESAVRVLHPHIGAKVVCGNCKSTLEVVWLEPIELDWPLDDDYDDFDDFDEYDDYDDD